jgi:serine/threonine protein kinase
MVKKVGPYELRNVIGRGTFGTVYYGKHSASGNEIAVKVIPKESLKPELQLRLEQEIQCQRSVSSENIVKLLDVQKTENNFYLILEYCKGGDLASFIKKNGKVSEEVAHNWLKQIAEAFRVLTEKNIIHRDLKLQNILMTEASTSATLKLADFGLSRFLEDDLAKTWVGTPLYMAPEIVNCQEYDSKADIWSLGLVLFELLTGTLPLRVANRNEIPEAQRKLLAPPEELSENCKDLLKKLLAYDACQRISFGEIFEHPFICPKEKQVVEPVREFDVDEDLSDFDEDFVLLDRDESVNDNLVVMKDEHPMLNVQSLLEEISESFATSRLLWSLSEKFIKESKNWSGCCLLIKSCNTLELQLIQINETIEKFALTYESFPLLFKSIYSLKDEFQEKLRTCEETFGLIDENDQDAGVEKNLLRSAVELCNQASQQEYLRNYEVSIEKYQDALRLLKCLTQHFCLKDSEDLPPLEVFLKETRKRLESVKAKMCLE